MAQLGVDSERSVSQLLWAGLLAYSGDPAAACTASRGDLALDSALRLGFEQIDNGAAGEDPRIIDFSAVVGDRDAIRRSVELFAGLPDQHRADVLTSLLTGDPEPSHEVLEAVAALERRSDRSIDDILHPLLSSTPWQGLEPRASDGSRGMVATAFALMVTATVGALVWAWDQPPPDVGEVSPTTAVTTPASATTEPTPELGPLLTNPDRRIDVALTTDGLVERRDPASGEIIWQAGPYADATWIRLDLNTVTVDRGQRGRIFVNLVDGTLMPP